MDFVRRSEPLPTSASGPDWTLPPRRGDDINLRTLLGTLDYRRSLLLLPMVLLGALSAFVALQIEDRYTSSTQVMLNSRETNIVDIASVISTLPGDARMIEGEISVILSNDNLNRVALDLGLYADPEFNPAAAEGQPATPSAEGPLTAAQIETIKRLRQAVNVSQVGLSLVISISATASDPQRAAAIADAIARQYIEAQVDVRLAATREAVDWLSERAETLRVRVETAERQIEDLRGAIILGEGQTSEATDLQLAETNRQLVLARADRAEAEARLGEVTRRIEAGLDPGIDLLAPSPSSAITRLREEIEALAAERSRLATQFGASNPRLQTIDEQVADLDRRLQEETSRAVEALAGMAATARVREVEIARSLAELETQLLDQSAQSLEMRQLERVAEADRSIYQTFLQRLNELTQQVGIQQAEARIISSAVPPELPSGPNRKLIVAGATVFGLLVGIALVFVVEAANTAFRTDVDIRQRLGLRTLARLPRLARPSEPLQALTDARAEPFGPLGQAARDLTVSLISSGHETLRTIVVTASTRGEQSTALALLLAGGLARIGRRTVIVDCSFGDPALSRALGATAAAGLGEVLAGSAPLEQALYRDAATGLDVLPIVAGQDHGPELLHTQAFRELLEALETRYDAVVLEAAPLAAGKDACALGRFADLVVLAVRWGVTSQEVVEGSVSQLAQGGAARIGAVLTQVNSRQEQIYRKRVYNLGTA